MSDLRTLQARMARAILNRDFEPVAGELSAGSASPASRLSIYANNTYLSLKACLKAIFPVTQMLADERFFDYAADVFIGRCPPAEARLSRFGAGFPRFLAGFAPCRDYPIIAQMAALEWAIADMMTAPQLRPAPMSDIAAIARTNGDPGIGLQPNLRFVVSEWPLVQIWGDHRNGAQSAAMPPHPSISRIAISRQGDSVQFMTIEPARFAFWRALARGFPIRVAAARALGRDRLFDLVSEIALLFRLDLVTQTFATESKGNLQ